MVFCHGAAALMLVFGREISIDFRVAISRLLRYPWYLYNSWKIQPKHLVSSKKMVRIDHVTGMFSLQQPRGFNMIHPTGNDDVFSSASHQDVWMFAFRSPTLSAPASGRNLCRSGM